MEDYLLPGPSVYKRQRLGGVQDTLQSSANYLDGRSNMVPFGFISSQERDTELSMAAAAAAAAAMPGIGASSLIQTLNPAVLQDFGGGGGGGGGGNNGPLPLPNWRNDITLDLRNRCLHKILHALTQRNGENADGRSPSKWSPIARKIEAKLFKAAVSSNQYYDLVKDELHKIQMGFNSFPNNLMSSQYLPSSSTTSAAANNLQMVSIGPGYGGPNGFGEPVPAAQLHSQPGLAHSAPSVSIFSDEAMGGVIRLPSSSSIASLRYDAFNGRPPGHRPIHDQLPGSIPIGFSGDPSQFVANPEQALPQNLLHSMNLLANPLNQFMPSSVVASQQRFGLSDPGQGVLSENSMNSQGSNRMQSKEWHKTVTFNIRNSIIRKMGQLLSTLPDPQAGNLESKMHSYITMATNIENETYKTANSAPQYYDSLVKRCLYMQRGNQTQPGIPSHYSPSEIRRMYEALGIPYPMGGSPFSNNNPGSNGVNNGAGNMRLHNNDASLPPPPPGVIVQNMMASAGAPPPPPLPYGAFRSQIAAATAAIQQANHNQILDRFLQGAVQLNIGASEVPEVVKQLAHSYKCLERENQENDVMLLCTLPHCRETKDLINHLNTCQTPTTACCGFDHGSTKEIIDHWNQCNLGECNICLPLRQAERSINSTIASVTSLNNQVNINPVYLRRPHRSMGSNYPSTATSGLLSNQSQNGPSNSGRADRISPRSSMWHSNYNDNSNWRPVNSDMSMDNGGGGGGRRSQRFWLHNRNNSGNRHERRAPYTNPWAPEIIFVDNSRSAPRNPPVFGPMGGRNMDRLQPYGTPWRSPDILFVENVRPAHRQPQDDEPVIIPPEEDAPPSEHQQIMAIVNVIKVSGCRLEQKFRCSKRGCDAKWPCLHRRLAANVRGLATPIPG